MDRLETARTLVTALQSNDMETAARLLADSFKIDGLTPTPLDRGQFLAVQSELLDALPDFSYNFANERAEQDAITGTIRISGTNQKDLSLPLYDLESIPATGLAISLPEVPIKFSFQGERVTALTIEAVPGGGLGGLLQQIGAELPVQPRESTFSDPAYIELQKHIPPSDK
ncbi:hypothetical protein EPA93_27710 [Ktedonosporobacter rubrisoli]|uniref:Nuclear transport factor 2 family protein n=1 Tax=Ktedonosporobacter rubrisoli TaxID=2509675 RepID=A0A4P6JV69_KTERU|nr:hypothetical protein [Ktedonosporobacter rubrisoli]QBD79558.1 hypothetical protein EPA93_27710 [Ktedonosporobacter rubrisoli]